MRLKIHTNPQDTKLADTRALLAEEQIVAGITGLEAGFLFLNAETNEAQVQGSEKRKGVAKHHFLHMREGRAFVIVVPAEKLGGILVRTGSVDVADGRRRSGTDTMPSPKHGGGSPNHGVQQRRAQNADRGRSSPAESSASAAAAPGTSPEPQQIGPDDFHFVQIVGRGSCGVVWEAVKVDTRETYAIKVLEKVLRMTPRVHDVSSRLVVGPQNPRR